ncbi:MAG: hypothetical protein U5K70_00350 [Halodesulfurarchaeum sp.]|nr:hypothetical protein [Halodesulfurarchaeum sp.]
MPHDGRGRGLDLLDGPREFRDRPRARRAASIAGIEAATSTAARTTASSSRTLIGGL